jgi:hypothetical protein
MGQSARSDSAIGQATQIRCVLTPHEPFTPWPFEPAEVAANIAAGDLNGIGERLTQVFFQAWEHPQSRAPLLATLRGAATHEDSATLVRQFIKGRLYPQIVKALPGLTPNCGSIWRWPNCWASPICATSLKSSRSHLGPPTNSPPESHPRSTLTCTQ